MISGAGCTVFDVFFYAESIGDSPKALKRSVDSVFSKNLKMMANLIIVVFAVFCNILLDFGDEIWHTVRQFRIESALKFSG